MEYDWMPITGEFIKEKDHIVFKGKKKEYQGQAGTVVGAELGELIFNKYFSGGKITATVEFVEISESSSCELIIHYSSAPPDLRVLSVGFTSPIFMFDIREYNDNKWNFIAFSGDRRNLKPNKRYILEVTLKGSKISLKVDGINVLSANLPFSLPQSQVGVWCQDYKDIRIYDFSVETMQPKAFVVMEFSGHFNEYRCAQLFPSSVFTTFLLV